MPELQIIKAQANNLRDFSLRAPLKEIVAIVGPSGAGKTTLLRDILSGEWRRRTGKRGDTSPQNILGLPPVFYFANRTSPRSRELVLQGLGVDAVILELLQRRGILACLNCSGPVRKQLVSALYLELRSRPNQNIVIAVPITREEFEATSSSRVIVSGILRRAEEIDDEMLSSQIYAPIDSLKVSERSSGRLLEALKLAQQRSPEAIYLLNEGVGELIPLVPTCTTCAKVHSLDLRETHSEANRWCQDCRGRGSVSQLPCLSCEGTGFTQELLNVYLGSLSFRELLNAPLSKLHQWAAQFAEYSGVEAELRESLFKTVEISCELGLGYLSFGRRLETLSSGEFQRVKLTAALSEQVFGALLALDEPSSGLNAQDSERLAKVLRSLREGGNSLFVATHDREIIAAATTVFELNGTSVAAERSRDEILRELDVLPVPLPKRTPSGWLQLSGITINNLSQLECQIPLNCLTCVSGVSGSGKSSLVLNALRPLAKALISERRNDAELSMGRVVLQGEKFLRVVSHQPLTLLSRRRSAVANALGIVPLLRDLYLRSELARVKGLTARSFQFTGANEKVADIRFRGVAFVDLPKLTINDALELFRRIPKVRRKLQTAVDFGVGYLQLGQKLRNLSSGEEQRLSLVERIALTGEARTLFILDEPLIGLSREEQKRVVTFLQSLVSSGHTVVAIEHSPLLMQLADYSIVLGPGAGAAGGKIISS